MGLEKEIASDREKHLPDFKGLSLASLAWSALPVQPVRYQATGLKRGSYAQPTYSASY
jgi:hypothetical protein